MNTFEVSKIFGKSLLLLNCYFLSVLALSKLKELNACEDEKIHIVTKAKKNCRTYKHPIKKHRKRRPSKKGKTVKLIVLFDTHHRVHAIIRLDN